ncbi:MAG TPA: DUF6498-containing protein [Thermoanaerobaculia bacterium]
MRVQTGSEPRPPQADAPPPGSLAQFAVTLVRNGVPIWGFFSQGWSPATTLVVYWAETLIGTLLIASRMAIHRHLTHKRGYEIEAGPATITVESGKGAPRKLRLGYVSAFLVGALAFILVHGIFLFALIKLVLPQTDGGTVDPQALSQGGLATGGLLVLGFFLDLVGMRERPFAWIRSMAEGAFSRIVVVHITIVIGMGLAMLLHRARPLFTLFVALKFLADVSAHTPQWRPKEAPAWMSRLLNRVPDKTRGSEDFGAYWKRTEAQERAREAEDELVDG